MPAPLIVAIPFDEFPVKNVPTVKLRDADGVWRLYVLVISDGQHRIAGFAVADVSLYCHVVKGMPLEYARHLFLKLNSKATLVTKIETLEASHTNCAMRIKALMRSHGGPYDIGGAQIHNLFAGLTKGRSKRGYSNNGVVLEERVFSQAKAIIASLVSLRGWFSYHGNTSKSSASRRSKVAFGTKMLAALGKACREGFGGRPLTPDQCREFVMVLYKDRAAFGDKGRFGSRINDSSRLRDAVRTYLLDNLKIE